MGCFFSLVHCVTETLGDERLAIGIIAVEEDESSAVSAFIQDWRRVRAFLGKHPKPLQDYCRSLSAEASAGGLIASALTRQRLHELFLEPGNAVKITEPAYADASAAEWVSEFGDLFVRDLNRLSSESDRPTQREVAGETRKVIRDVLKERFRLPTAEQVVSRAEIPGPYGNMRILDAAVRNGRIHFGARAMTFDHEERYTQGQIDQIAQELLDLRQALPATPLMMVADPFSTEALTRHQRTELENQMRARCLAMDVAFGRVSDPESILRHLTPVLTPETLSALAAD